MYFDVNVYVVRACVYVFYVQHPMLIILFFVWFFSVRVSFALLVQHCVIIYLFGVIPNLWFFYSARAAVSARSVLLVQDKFAKCYDRATVEEVAYTVSNLSATRVSKLLAVVLHRYSNSNGIPIWNRSDLLPEGVNLSGLVENGNPGMLLCTCQPLTCL